MKCKIGKKITILSSIIIIKDEEEKKPFGSYGILSLEIIIIINLFTAMIYKSVLTITLHTFL